MQALFRIGLRVVLLAAVIAGMARAWDRETEKVQEEVSRLTGKMKTVCVGRFLVDLPENAQYELRGPRIHGFEIAVFDESEHEFRARVLSRKAQLEASSGKTDGSTRLELSAEVKSEHGAAGLVFVHNLDVTEGQSSDGLTVQRYRYESVSVEALLHANGISIDIAAPEYDPTAIANLTKLISRLVPNPQNRIPSEPGYCIDRAYILDPLTADQAEQIMMDAWLPDRPDIFFKMILAAGTEPDQQGLLQRGKESDAGLTIMERMRVQKLRADRRKIGGIDGEELVERFVESPGVVVHSLWWEVNGTKDDVFVPHLVFKMDTGQGDNGPVPSSLSDAAALELWDKISSSIRLKATRPEAGTQAAPARLAGA